MLKNLYLFRSEKVEKSYFHSRLLEKENYKKYLIEGLSQGKRTQLPSVTVHKRFKHFIEYSVTLLLCVCDILTPTGDSIIMLSISKNLFFGYTLLLAYYDRVEFAVGHTRFPMFIAK